MSNQTIKKTVELRCDGPAKSWKTPIRTSQSLSSAVSPSGRYIFVVYLFGVNVLDTKTDDEHFHLIHPDQEIMDEPDFNICGFVSISDSIGYTIERTDEDYGDYYLRRIDFNHDNPSFDYEQQPRTLAFNVKCLTVCYDYQVETNELNVILRKKTDDNDPNDGGWAYQEVRLWCCYKLVEDNWVETRNRVRLEELSAINSWDLFPKFHNNALHVFPVQPSSTTVYSKLKQFNQLACVDAETGELEMVPVKSQLEKWAVGKKYDEALFVDNMDYKWIETELFLLFVIAIQDDGRSASFENRLATFSLERLEWRPIEIDQMCRGEAALNPYRMQITPDMRLFLVIPGAGHPCTTFGQRKNSAKKRMLWRPKRNEPTEHGYVTPLSYAYSVTLGKKKPDQFQAVASQTVHQIYPQLTGRKICEFRELLTCLEPPTKRVKMPINATMENEELAGDATCSSTV